MDTEPQPELIVPSERDAAALVAALLDSAPPNERLIQAAREYLCRADVSSRAIS